MLKIQFDEHILRNFLNQIIAISSDENKIFAQNIKSQLDAYGTSYNFLSFYQHQENGCLLILSIFDSMCLCCGLNEEFLSPDSVNQINEFVFCFLKPTTISCSKTTFDTLFCKLSSYINIKQNVHPILKKSVNKNISNNDFELTSISPWDFCVFIKNNYDDFSVTDFDKWYCDISHKTRHFQTNLFALRQNITNKIVSVCSSDFSGDDFKYISSVCTEKASRNNGFARILLSLVENTDNKSTYLMPSNHSLVEYYKKMGYENCGHAVIICAHYLI